MARIGECLDLYGGRQGVWREEKVAQLPGKLRVEAVGDDWSVTYFDEENDEAICCGVMRTAEGYVVLSNDLITKCFYRADGQLEAVKMGISSLVNHWAERGMDPYLVNADDWARLRDLNEARGEVMFVVFLGNEEFSPYWCLQQVSEGLDSGPVLEVEVVDPLLVSSKIKTAVPLFIRSLGGFNLKFSLLVDDREVRFGVFDKGRNQILAHAIRRKVSFDNLRNRVRFDQQAKLEDLDGIMGKVSPGLKLFP